MRPISMVGASGGKVAAVVRVTAQAVMRAEGVKEDFRVVLEVVERRRRVAVAVVMAALLLAG